MAGKNFDPIFRDIRVQVNKGLLYLLFCANSVERLLPRLLYKGRAPNYLFSWKKFWPIACGHSVRFWCYFLLCWDRIPISVMRCNQIPISVSAVHNANRLYTLSKKSLRVYEFSAFAHDSSYSYLPLYTFVLHNSSLHHNVMGCFLWLASSAYQVDSPSQEYCTLFQRLYKHSYFLWSLTPGVALFSPSAWFYFCLNL